MYYYSNKDNEKPKNLLTKLAGLTFKCTKCTMVFGEYTDYKRHLAMKTQDNKVKKCKEENCTFTSCTFKGLQEHIVSEHQVYYTFEDFQKCIKCSYRIIQ